MKDYKENSVGHMVPVANISEWDLFRDQLVEEIFAKADAIQQQMQEFKNAAMSDVDACVRLAAEKYGKELGGNVGNVTLTNFSGTKRVQICIAKHIEFDERIVAAKAIIYDCVKKWTSGSNANVVALIDLAFKEDKNGKLSATKLLSLLRLEINDDEEWNNAMLALKDSIQIIGSSSYLRFYNKKQGEKYEQMTLDMSSL